MLLVKKDKIQLKRLLGFSAQQLVLYIRPEQNFIGLSMYFTPHVFYTPN